MDLKSSFKWNLLLLGIFLIICAALLQYFSQIKINEDNHYQLLACIFSLLTSTIGGCIIAKAFETDNQILSKFSSRLSSIIRKNSLNTASINKIIQSDIGNPISIRIQDTIPHLSSVTTDLTNLIGRSVDPEVSELNKTLKQLCEISLQMEDTESKNGKYNITQDSKAKFEAIIDKALDISDSISPAYDKIEEDVICPFCNEHNYVFIGSLPPASAMPQCKKCKKRFHANRRHDGSVLIKQPGFRH